MNLFDSDQRIASAFAPNVPHRPRQRVRIGRNRRGATIMLAAIMMATLVGMLAFSVDIGYLAASKAELRRTADAAALAACWQMFDSAVAGESPSQTSSSVRTTAVSLAGLNRVCNHGAELETLGQTSDVREGYLENMSATATLNSNSTNPFRAVSVRIRKTDDMNGDVPFFFAPILGHYGREVTVNATAAFATQIKGFKTPTGGAASNLDVLPFALDLQTWNNLLSGGGTDGYRYNAACESVTAGSDGIREVNLYPQGTGSPGNRGTVDIGGSNNSTADIARQIVSGISADDLNALGKPLLLNSDGVMTLNGDTGISAGVKDELASIIGQTRIIPIFSSVSGNGNNAMYTIVKWVGVRILAVRLTGPMSSKMLMVQPAPMIARNVVVGDSSRQWSDQVFSPVVLVQ